MSISANATALVIGGSGMLAGACKELAKQYGVVGVIGRTKSKMQNLLEAEDIVPIYIDYSDTEVLETALTKFTAKHGRPSLTVSWVHSTSPEAPLLVARFCTGAFYDVAGTSDKQKAMTDQNKIAIEKLGLNYHRIILGHMGERWLTDEEISDGVLEAIASSKKELVVGLM